MRGAISWAVFFLVVFVCGVVAGFWFTELAFKLWGET